MVRACCCFSFLPYFSRSTEILWRKKYPLRHVSFGSRCVLVTAKLSHFVFLPGRDIYVSWKSTQYDEHADRLIIPLKISSSYTCVKFYYRMWGVQIGRLNVYFRDLHEQDRMLWKLFGDQNSTWKEARIPVEITDLYYEVNLFLKIQCMVPSMLCSQFYP